MRTLGLIFLSLGLSACGASVKYESFQETALPEQSVPGGEERSARVIFHRDHFIDLEDFLRPDRSYFSEVICTGDVTRVHQTSGGDYASTFPVPSGAPITRLGLSPFQEPDPNHPLKPTYRPYFLRNVSVDITRTYYTEINAETLTSDICSMRGGVKPRLPSPCADFDPDPFGPKPAPSPTNGVVLPAPSSFPPPLDTPDYVNGLLFYRVRDPWCLGQGPLETPTDPEVSKAYVGGVNLDLDRNRIGAQEDLLMLITYQSFGEGESWPNLNQNPPKAVSEAEFTRIQVDLLSTKRGLEALLQRPQPRIIGDMVMEGLTNVDAPPVLLRKLVTLEDPFPSLKTESVIVPLSQNRLIDRIRIQRIRGSFQLYQIDLYLLGNREGQE